MNKISSICKQLFVLLIAMLFIPAFAFADAGKIFKNNSNSVVVVVTYNGKGEPIIQGSGFIVRSDGAIVTNYHVISNAKDIKIKAGGKILDVEGLIYTDKENDIVILKAKGEKLPVVRLGDIEKATIGERVYVISSPEGLENTISDGLLSGIRDIISDKKVLQITAPISPGSSGGPVFNIDGEVIGIATFLIKEAQNLNFAMPVNLIKDKIANNKFIVLKESAIEDYNKTSEYWFVLGYNYASASLHKDAIKAFKHAIEINPDHVEALAGLGVSYYNLGMYKEAMELSEQAIRIKPDYAEAYNLLGGSYNQLNMHNKAKGAFEQAIEIRANYAEAYYGLGVSYSKLGMHKDAIATYKQVVRITPDDVKAYYNLGTSYGKSGMYKEAIEVFREAIKLAPDLTLAHFNLGIACVITNDKSSALEEYKILKKLDPGMAEELFKQIYN